METGLVGTKQFMVTGYPAQPWSILFFIYGRAFQTQNFPVSANSYSNKRPAPHNFSWTNDHEVSRPPYKPGRKRQFSSIHELVAKKNYARVMSGKIVRQSCRGRRVADLVWSWPDPTTFKIIGSLSKFYRRIRIRIQRAKGHWSGQI